MSLWEETGSFRLYRVVPLIKIHSPTPTHTRYGTGRYLVLTRLRANRVPEVEDTYEQKQYGS